MTMYIAMAASFLFVTALAAIVMMRFFDRLKGPDNHQFHKWLSEHPEKVAEILDKKEHD